jgi:hypothetical protein
VINQENQLPQKYLPRSTSSSRLNSLLAKGEYLEEENRNEGRRVRDGMVFCCCIASQDIRLLAARKLGLGLGWGGGGRLFGVS